MTNPAGSTTGRLGVAALVASYCLLSVSTDALACSRALWAPTGQPVLIGRNMDWTSKMGTKLYAMPKGMRRQGMTPANAKEWVSKYGSVVAIIWDCATSDGMNEAGLNANLLYLAETKYAEPDASREGISISVVIQYYLDNFATVAEAVEATSSFQLQSFKITHKGEQVEGPVHVSLADATGDSAIIEILDGEVVIHHGKQYTVMTNSPPYDEQLVLIKQYQGLGGNKPLPGTADADDRFVRGAYYLTKLPEAPESYQEAVAGVLSVMRNMATPIGANDPIKPNISATLWRSISDLTNRRYYFEFTTMPNVVWVNLKNLNLEKGAPVQVFDLRSDIEASGEVSGRFENTKPVKFQMAGTVLE